MHARVGGFAGSNLQLTECPTTPNTTVTAANLNYTCIAAYLSVHITPSASGVYLENNWIWVADHDVEDSQLRQITIFAGRGLLDESATGTVWLVGTAVEHHTKYQYQFVNTRDVFAGQVRQNKPILLQSYHPANLATDPNRNSLLPAHPACPDSFPILCSS